jgi:transcriptional regulator with XRE-family HTH domain
MAEKRFSLRSLATKMGMTHSQLSLTFSGARRMQLDEAVKLSQLLGVPLSSVAANAGVDSNFSVSRRVRVIGALHGSGEVEVYDSSVIERTTVPEGLPDEVVAVQARTLDSPLAWMDGWVFFCMPPNGGVDPGVIGRFCVVACEGGPALVALVRRGYREGTYNLSGPVPRESQRLTWATPVLMTRN